MTPYPDLKSDSPLLRRALIVTALPVEYRAAREHLTNLQEFETPLGAVGETGRLQGRETHWDVSLLQAQMGNENAALETERGIHALDPEAVLFLGVAGGIKDVVLGDVLVASKVYAYEYGKAADSFRPRPEVLEPSYKIFQRAVAIARSEAWRARLRLPALGLLANAVVKPLAAGSKVVSDSRAEVARLLRGQFSDAAAVEMEGYGFLRALQAHPGRERLVVRGISDLLDEKEATDTQGWQAIASAMAAAFAFEVLANLSLATVPKAGESPAREEEPEPGEPEEDTFWKDLHALLVQLYEGGPGQNHVWRRSGGELARISIGNSPWAAWYEAIELLRQGGGGASLSLFSLLRTVREDYPNKVEAARLARLASSR